jgi:hypothetical protein
MQAQRKTSQPGSRQFDALVYASSSVEPPNFTRICPGKPGALQQMRLGTYRPRTIGMLSRPHAKPAVRNSTKNLHYVLNRRVDQRNAEAEKAMSLFLDRKTNRGNDNV